MGKDGPRFVVPDWRQYGPKINEIPMLKQYSDNLAAKGLKDPWLRNHVWKYMPENSHMPMFPFKKAVARSLLRDFIPAAIAAYLTVKAIKYFYPDEHHDDHH